MSELSGPAIPHTPHCGPQADGIKTAGRLSRRGQLRAVQPTSIQWPPLLFVTGMLLVPNGGTRIWAMSRTRPEAIRERSTRSRSNDVRPEPADWCAGTRTAGTVATPLVIGDLRACVGKPTCLRALPLKGLRESTGWPAAGRSVILGHWRARSRRLAGPARSQGLSK